MSSINKMFVFYVGTDSNIQSPEGFQCFFFILYLGYCLKTVRFCLLAS